jgi:hypothetical protein
MLGLPAVDSVAAFDDGHTFWSQALSPIAGGPSHDIVGGRSEVYVAQSWRKDTPDASLAFSFSGAHLELMNYGAARGDGYGVYAFVGFSAIVVAHDSAEEVWSEGQTAWLYQDFNLLHDQTDNRWALRRDQAHEPTASGMAPWSWSCPACFGPDYGFVTAELVAPYTGVVDLSAIDVGSEFTIGFHLTTSAIDYAQGETAAVAYARDPTGNGGAGIDFAFAGLTPTNQPVAISAVPEPPATTLVVSGLAVVAWIARRRGRRSERGRGEPEGSEPGSYNAPPCLARSRHRRRR